MSLDDPTAAGLDQAAFHLTECRDALLAGRSALARAEVQVSSASGRALAAAEFARAAGERASAAGEHAGRALAASRRGSATAATSGGLNTPVRCMAGPDLRPFIVMVVEAHRDTLEMFEYVLRMAGAKVIAAPSPLRALTILQTVIPSVIVTNIEMPEIDGFSFIAAVREIPATGHVPMIATTAVPLERQRQGWNDAGFARVLVKPVDPLVLCAMIAEAIDHATATQATQSKREVAGVPLPLIDVGTISVAAFLRLQAAARASCETTRRLRADSRDIRQQASLVRIAAAQVRDDRRSRAAARGA